MFGTSVNPMQMRLHRRRHAPHLQDIRCTRTISTHTHASCETELLGKLHWQAPHVVSFIGRQDTSVVAAATDNHHQHTTYKNIYSPSLRTHRLLLLLWVAAMSRQKRRDARFPRSLRCRLMNHDRFRCQTCLGQAHLAHTCRRRGGGGGFLLCCDKSRLKKKDATRNTSSNCSPAATELLTLQECLCALGDADEGLRRMGGDWQ